MRTFIAIDVNDEVKKISEEVIEKLMRRGFRANWVTAENVHLTLFFLGEVHPKKVDEVSKHVCKRLRGFPSFSFTVKGVHFFRKGKSPRVIWLGVEPSESLIRLYDEMRSELFQHGFEFESSNNFIPHITIGRIKQYPQKWEKLIEDITYTPIVVAVDNIVVYSSKLTPRGPIYKWIYKCHFEGGLTKNE